jgi:hypothetical protein
MSTVTVTPFTLMQWRSWLRMEVRLGKAAPHSRGSVKAHAARAFGLSPRAKREIVLEHVEAALAACENAGAALTARVELEMEQ